MLNRDAQPGLGDGVEAFLQHRLGRLHARQRLGIEADHEAQAFGQGLNFFHIENWSLSPLCDPFRALAGRPVRPRPPQRP